DDREGAAERPRLGLDGDPGAGPADRAHRLAETDVEPVGEAPRELVVAALDLAERLGAEVERVRVDEAEWNRGLDLDQRLEERVRRRGQARAAAPGGDCLERDGRLLGVRGPELLERRADRTGVEQLA